MSLPISNQSSDGFCSVVFNRTLYSYSPSAFQSLKLEKNAQWEQLPMGIPVRGGVCVHKTPSKNSNLEAMFVVGGVTKSDPYHGLQRFTFNSKKWDTIVPSDPVAQNRMYHGATYLNASDSILIYSGTQDERQELSSQTFTIQASEPYQVSAFQSIAPPAISPILLPWSNSQAVYLGGSITNKKVMIFDPKTSWVDSKITLANPVFNTGNIKSTVISGPNPSKILYTFDLSKSPNSVNVTVITRPDGSPIQNAQPTFNRGTSSLPQDGRNLTGQNLPSYDAALAPRVPRESCTISQDESGLIVFSGISRVDAISVFNSRVNRWEDTSFIGSKEVSQSNDQVDIKVSEENLTNPQDPIQTPPFPGKILGAVLGSILFSAITILVLLVSCRSRKRKSIYDKTNSRKHSDGPDDKDGMDFMDKGIPDVMLEKYSVSSQRGQKHSKNNDDYNYSHQVYKDTISKPISSYKPNGEEMPSYFEETRAAPHPNDDRSGERRSSGWNRYWSNDSNSNTDYHKQYGGRTRRNTDSLTIRDRTDTYYVGSESSKSDHNKSKKTSIGDLRGYTYEPSSRKYEYSNSMDYS